MGIGEQESQPDKPTTSPSRFDYLWEQMGPPITGKTITITPIALDAAQTKASPSKTVLYYEQGGRLDEHTERFRKIAALGGEVEIRNLCQSACTLILAHIPKDRLCFAERAYLNFHMATTLDHTPSLYHTKWMIDQYPENIRQWIEAKGGPSRMPLQRFWTLRASELWQMGYRRCAD